MKTCLAMVLVLSGCSCAPEPPGEANAGNRHGVTMSTNDEIPSELRQRSVGHVFFGVGGGRNDHTKKFEHDPAYQSWFLVLVQGDEAFRWGAGRMFIIGTGSSEGAAILRILNTEAPWDKEAEDLQVFANHLVFAGELNGRSWEYSRRYPDPAIDRIVRSIGPVLDRVPLAPFRYLTPVQMREHLIGGMVFRVAGAPNAQSRDLRADPALRGFTVVFVQGTKAYQRPGRVFIVGRDSSQGASVLRLIDVEKPWDRKQEESRRAVNNMLFEGEIDGKRWKYSRQYPDQSIGRIVRSLNQVLDGVPRGE